MPEVGVGAVKHEQVGKAADADTFVGLGAALPGLVQILSVQAGNLHR